MATSSLQAGSALQDDWINMLAGMDQFLDEVTDSIPLNSPTLGPIAGTMQPAASEVQFLSPPTSTTSHPTVKHVEGTSMNSRTLPSGQASGESKSIPPKNVRSGTNATNMGKDISAEAKAQARSERKRTREKQRRLDVNSQIVDLTTLLLKVEADEEESNGASSKSKPINSPSNRVELISRTIGALSKLHTENKKRGIELVDLQSKLKELKKEKESTEIAARQSAQPQVSVQPNADAQKQPMIMMVPMMMSQDGNFMPQAMQMPMQMQMCPQGMYPSQATNAVYPSMVQQEPQVVYYPSAPTPAPAASPVQNPISAPVPMQQQSVPLKQTNVVQKPFKQQEKIIGQSYNTVAFDSSHMNINVVGNLAHCA